MLLDDSIELECNDSSANLSPEPLHVNWNIDLSKIWIPSSLLPNRKKQINPNENKHFILHTLERPDYSKAFSTYSDEFLQHNESHVSSGVPSIISHKLINDNNNEDEIWKALPLFQNAAEWDTRSDIGSGNVISPKHPLNNNKLDDFLRDWKETNYPIIREAVEQEKKALNYSLQEASCRAPLEDLTRRMAEILSEDDPFKENWNHEDVIKINQVTTGSTVDSIPPSTKDSLEEIYYSDEDDNLFAVEYELDNLKLESPEKKPKCSIYTENSYFQELPSENFVNGPEQAEKSSDETVIHSSEEMEKIQLENRNVAVDNKFIQSENSELNGIESVAHTNYNGQKLLNFEGKSDRTEKVPEFPIAYKRPPLQEQTNKTKPQKEKKKSKKVKKNIPLKDLFQSEEADRFEVPEVDEFYENLVRQGKCKPHNQEMNNNGFPSVNFTGKLLTNVDEFPSIVLPDPPKYLFQDSALDLKQNLNGKLQSSSQAEILRNQEKVESELQSQDSLDVLVIDNIPLNVSKENIEDFLSGFGKLNKLTIERLGKFQRAKVQMDFIYEVNWIIDCLNDTEPFGSIDKVLIKCYLKHS